MNKLFFTEKAELLCFISQNPRATFRDIERKLPFCQAFFNRSLKLLTAEKLIKRREDGEKENNPYVYKATKVGRIIAEAMTRIDKKLKIKKGE